MRRTVLLLSTGSYPWDVAMERTFLEAEVEVMTREFERVIIVPQSVEGAREPIPSGVQVVEDYAREAAALSHADVLGHAVRSTLVADDVLRRGRRVMHRAALRELVAHAGRAQHASRWLPRFLARERIAPAACAVATFWWNAVTTGFALAKRRAVPRLCVVTRAHGFDLYEDRHTPPYIPCRPAGLRWLDGVFPDSDRGREHLEQAWGSALRRCETARLGVLDPGSRSRGSTDGVLRVVSCSPQRPIKRLDLLLDGVAAAARLTPDRSVLWTHFGTGPLQADLEARARATFPGNARVVFAGYSSQRELLAWYGENPADVFVNVSVSEGTPVALIEAAACGIPLLATAVGGNPEVVTDASGVRLAPNPTAADIAAALQRFAGGDDARRWRAGSRETWSARYDARANYERFGRMLRDMVAR